MGVLTKIRNMNQLAAAGDRESRQVVLEIAEKTLQALDGDVLAVGGHPYPNEDGMNATKKILRLVEKAVPGDLFVGLMNGCSSALMNCPLDGVSFDDELTITRHLITRGARILEINAVPRHISQENGGLLAAKIESQGAEMINLIISDLAGDEVVGTPEEPVNYAGTQVGIDRTTFADALAVLK